MWSCVKFLAILTIFPANNGETWYSYQFGSGHGNREELQIKTLKGVSNFSSENVVLKWKSLSLRSQAFALGLAQNGVSLIHASLNETKESFVTNELFTTLNTSKIYDAEIFEHQQEIFILVALETKDKIGQEELNLLWFKFNDTKNLIQISEKSLEKVPTHLKVFQMENKLYLLIGNKPGRGNYITADVYEMDLHAENFEFWHIQVLHLQHAITSSATLDFQDEYFLALPQNSKLSLYKFIQNRFVNFESIDGEAIDFVTSFQIGTDSYVAISGRKSAIYKFTPNNMEIQEVEGANTENINFWMSIPIRTYRDEQIVIAEHTVDFHSHKTNALQIILHQEGKFVVHDEVECDFFGHRAHGFNCLLEEGTLHEIKNGTYLVLENNIGLLLPQENKSSLFFTIHTQMVERPSPIEEQMKKFNIKKAEIEEKISKLKADHSFTKNEVNIKEVEVIVSSGIPESASLREEPSNDILNLDTEVLSARISKLQDSINKMLLDLPKLGKIDPSRAVFDNLVINGDVEVQGSENKINQVNTQKFNGFETDENFGDVFNANSQGNRPITGNKTFENLRTDNLNFQIINGVENKSSVHNFEPMTLDNAVIQGNLTVLNKIEANRINNNLTTDQIMIVDQVSGPLHFETLLSENLIVRDAINEVPVSKLQPETLLISGNLTVKAINNIELDDFISKLVFKNIRTYVQDVTKIFGNVFVGEKALTLNLNGLKFPLGYVMAKSTDFTEISAKKIFTNELVVEELITNGTVNTINLNDVITLNEEQTIPENVTFEHLTVTENLKLNGTIKGDIPDSPDASLNLHEILGHVNFKELEVQGSIILRKMFNGTNLQNILQDVIYKDMNETEINSVKQFPLGLTTTTLEVDSNSLKNVKIQDLVNKEADQVLNIAQLNGDVIFENLQLEGNYNGVNITKLEEDSVKISGEQFISAKLIFEEDLNIENLEIKESVNEIPLERFWYKESNVSMDHLSIEKVNASDLKVLENLIAENENFGLGEFVSRRFSKGQDQNITGSYKIDFASIIDLNASKINEQNFKNIFSIENYAKKILKMMSDGNLSIKDLVVQDSIRIENLNQFPMSSILKHCISQENDHLDFVFKNHVQIHHLKVNNFNGIRFDEFLDNLVFKDQERVEILENKFYINGFDVKNYIQSEKLNGIPIENILRKNNKQEIKCPLKVDTARVTLTESTKVMSKINGIPIKDLEDKFRTLDENFYQINGDVVFENVAFIDDFLIDYLNDINVLEFVKNLVPLSSPGEVFVQNVTFGKGVNIMGNLQANKKINSVNITDFKDNVVSILQDSDIPGEVSFKNLVLSKELDIDNDILSKGINGINITKWNEEAHFINRGLIVNNLIFESVIVQENIKSKFINNVDLGSLIHLRADQNISMVNMTCMEMKSFGNIRVHNLVNGYELLPEFENSVLSSRPQQVEDNIIFNSKVLINGNLKVGNTINEQDISKIVTTNTDQNLTGNFQFLGKVSVDLNAKINGKVNKYNLTEWVRDCITKESEHSNQVIAADWKVDKNLTFAKNMTGNGSINGLDILNLAKTVAERRLLKTNIEERLVDNYEQICRDINQVASASKKQIFKFKYLENFAGIDLQEKIKLAHSFEFSGNFYILISGFHCNGSLFQWSPEGLHFHEKVKLGQVDQIITVKSLETVYLVTRASSGDPTCSVEGTNIWQFKDNSLILSLGLHPQSTLHESKVPGAFYGMDNEGVTEFRIVTTGPDLFVSAVQKWILPTGNAEFLGHGLKTGLAIRNGEQIYKLIRNEIHAEDIILDTHMGAIVLGNFTVEKNTIMPGKGDGEILIMKVGHPKWRTLMALASHDETSVQGTPDFIKVFEDHQLGTMFHKVPAYKPSSLISLEFDENALTLFIFLEDQKVLKVFEYKGLEGFKFHSKIEFEASKLIPLKLPNKSGTKSYFVGAIHKNELNILEAVMDGNHLTLDPLDCHL